MASYYLYVIFLHCFTQLYCLFKICDVFLLNFLLKLFLFNFIMSHIVIIYLFIILYWWRLSIVKTSNYYKLLENIIY